MITPGTILILAVIVGVPTLIVMGCIIVGMGKPKSFGGDGVESRHAPDVRLGHGLRTCERPAIPNAQPEAGVATGSPPIKYGDIRDSCERKIREKLKEIKRRAQ